MRSITCSVSCWAALKELLFIYRKQLDKNPFILVVSFFLLPTSTLYFWGLHTVDAICKLPPQSSVKLSAGGKVFPRRMEMKERRTIFGSLEKNITVSFRKQRKQQKLYLTRKGDLICLHCLKSMNA